jgi:hypothetical protein
MATSIRSMFQRRISLYVDRQERPWNTSSSDVRSRTSSNAAIYSNSPGQSLLISEESPSDSQQWTPNLEAVRDSVRFAVTTADLTPLDHADQNNDTNLTKLHLPPCAKDSGRASIAEDGMLNMNT